MKYAIFTSTNSIEIRQDSLEIVPNDAVLLSDLQYSKLISGQWSILSTGEILESVEIIELVPDPEKFTSLEYLDLFTEDEQIAVVSATMVIPRVKLWYDKMLAAGYITVADPRTEAGLAALVQAGLLQAERKSAILAQM